MNRLVLPEEGQIVRVRRRNFVVEEVLKISLPTPGRTLHRVTLEPIDEGTYGEKLDVVWEREAAPVVLEADTLPYPDQFDPPARFEAFLRAIEWAGTSVVEGPSLHAPFRGAVKLESYQLEPVVRALEMPRVTLLIADDVGLGKTVEAGLVLQEMISRRRARQILILCPASLQKQWQDEMAEKFGLHFEIVDRKYLLNLRRGHGIDVNPWASYPRLIASIDYIKRDIPLRQFEECARAIGPSRGIRMWDVLIIDEAHNVAPSGRRKYVEDSDRTRMVRRVAPYFEHRLFLTATPHNGFTESFAALLELLDPLRFARTIPPSPEQVRAVMVRRLKSDINAALGEQRFPERRVVPLEVVMGTKERELHDLLDRYTRSRLKGAGHKEEFAARFALTLLKKRLLSSPLAFARSIEVHSRSVGQATTDQASDDFRMMKRLVDRLQEDIDDDRDKEENETAVQEQAPRLFRPLTEEERRWLERMRELALDSPYAPDGKAKKLLAWIEDNLCPHGRWNNRRLIIFTEFKDTLEYLQLLLSGDRYKDRVLVLYGGMADDKREAVKQAFQQHPDENPVRILVATDAASEGLNLQNHCNCLIHYEIPWNPIRMEQRNGRVDRHGQRAREVFIHHFSWVDHADSQFLEVVVEKVQQIRADLGSVGDVIARQVEETLLGISRAPAKDLIGRRPEDHAHSRTVETELAAEIITRERIREIHDRVVSSRERLRVNPESLRSVLDQALLLSGARPLVPVEKGLFAGRAWRLVELPAAWRELSNSLEDNNGRRRLLVFDHETAELDDQGRTTVVHLEHPLMRRALMTLRGQLWNVTASMDPTTGPRLHRVSCKVVSSDALDTPVLVAFARLVISGANARRLHDVILPVGGGMTWTGELERFPDDRISSILRLPSLDAAPPDTLRERISRLFPSHVPVLQRWFRELREAEHRRLVVELRNRGKEEAKLVRRLINERIREVRARLRQLGRRLDKLGTGTDDGFVQLKLFDVGDFDRQEKAQLEEDLQWLEARLERLLAGRDSEPAAVEARYRVRSSRVIPVALLYVLPEKEVRQA